MFWIEESMCQVSKEGISILYWWFFESVMFEYCMKLRDMEFYTDSCRLKRDQKAKIYKIQIICKYFSEH